MHAVRMVLGFIIAALVVGVGFVAGGLTLGSAPGAVVAVTGAVVLIAGLILFAGLADRLDWLRPRR